MMLSMANVYVKGLDNDDYDLLNSLGFPSDRDEHIIEVTPNRPDMLSNVGIHRTLYTYKNRRTPSTYESSKLSIEFIINNVRSRPYIELALVYLKKPLDIEDLIQFQEKLHDTYGRKRKRVAIGLHDYSKIVPPIYYKEVEQERFVPLDSNKEMGIPEILMTEKGKEYGHLVSSPYPMLYDSQGVISFPPIINSDRTKLRDNTTTVLIDVTGINSYYVKETMRLLLCYMIDVGVYKIESTVSLDYKKIEASAEKIRSLIGIDEDYSRLLSMSGIDYDGMYAIVPPYRIDFMDWTDVAEEIAINYGYNNIPREYPKIYQDTYIKEDKYRDIMDRLGFNEVYSSFLVNAQDASKYMKVEKLLNALSEDSSAIRSSLEYSLLKIASKNRMAPLPYKIYEIGRVYDVLEYEQLGWLMMDDEIKVEDYISIIKAAADELDVTATIKHSKDIPMFNSSTVFYGSIGQIEYYVGAISYEVLRSMNIDKPIVIGIFKNIENK